MTEEEKEAIKYFRNLRSTIDESYMLFDEEITIRCGKETTKQITIMLNLIEKQDKIIKGNECVIETQANNEKVLLEAMEKKDKTIDKMAKWIFDKDYVENSLLIHRDDYYSNCIKQVIEYFEKKEE